MTHHCVEDGQELAHASREGHLLRFAGRDQAVVEGLDHRVVASGDESGHVQSSPNLRPATPDRTFAPEGATVTVEGRDANQGSYLAAVQLP